jgi:hypothetical protein
MNLESAAVVVAVAERRRRRGGGRCCCCWPSRRAAAVGMAIRAARRFDNRLFHRRYWRRCEG